MIWIREKLKKNKEKMKVKKVKCQKKVRKIKVVKLKLKLLSSNIYIFILNIYNINLFKLGNLSKRGIFRLKWYLRRKLYIVSILPWRWK